MTPFDSQDELSGPISPRRHIFLIALVGVAILSAFIFSDVLAAVCHLHQPWRSDGFSRDTGRAAEISGAYHSCPCRLQWAGVDGGDCPSMAFDTVRASPCHDGWDGRSGPGLRSPANSEVTR
jgi:hypothetical protein